jgi:hypothetical protein
VLGLFEGVVSGAADGYARRRCRVPDHRVLCLEGDASGVHTAGLVDDGAREAERDDDDSPIAAMPF